MDYPSWGIQSTSYIGYMIENIGHTVCHYITMLYYVYNMHTSTVTILYILCVYVHVVLLWDIINNTLRLN